MRAYKILAAAGFLFYFPFLFAQTATEFRVSDQLEGRITIGSDNALKTLPLPPGKWIVLNIADETSTPVAGSSYVKWPVKFSRIALGQVKDGKLDSMIVFRANVSSNATKWIDETCKRKDLFFSSTFDSGIWDQRCLEINHLVGYLSASDSFYLPIRKYLIENEITYDKVAISTAYTEYDQLGNWFQARITIFPSQYGFVSTNGRWAESEWHRDLISKYPDRQAFMNTVVAWSEKYASIMHLAFKAKKLNSPVYSQDIAIEKLSFSH